jgi:transcription elongation factor Elf1
MPWCPVCEENWTTPDEKDTLQLTCEPCRLEATGDVDRANAIRQKAISGPGLPSSGAGQTQAHDRELNGPWRCPRCNKVWRRYSARTTISTGKKTPTKQCGQCTAELQQRAKDEREAAEHRGREAKARRDKKARMQQELTEEREKARKWQPEYPGPPNRFGIKPRRRS